MKNKLMTTNLSCTLLCVFSLLSPSLLWSLPPISEDFRFLNQTYRSLETTDSGHKVEELKHFHVNASGQVVERTVTLVDGNPQGRERAWWYTSETQNNHYRIALLHNGNQWVTTMGRISSGYKGVGMNEAENGNTFMAELNYNAASGGKLRISSGPLVARGFVNDSMFWRKTWKLTNTDRETFNAIYYAAGDENIELSDKMKFLDPLIGVWEGLDEEGVMHRNMFVKHSPHWILEFWRIGQADGEGPRGVNIIGTDTLTGGTITRAFLGRRGYFPSSNQYVEAGPGTIIQFQGNGYLVRKVTGDTMAVTRHGLNGIRHEEYRSYKLERKMN